MKIWQQNCQELPLNTLRGQSQVRQNQSNINNLTSESTALKKKKQNRR